MPGRRHAPCVLVAVVVLLLGPTSTAWADDLEGTWALSGRAEGPGEWEGRVRIAPAGDQVRIRAEIELAEGDTDRIEARTSPSGEDGTVLRFRTPAGPFAGIVGRLAGFDPSSAELERVWRLEGDDRIVGRLHLLPAEGDRRVIGSETLERDESIWAWAEGTLIGLAREKVDELVHERRELAETFSLDRYVHVGMNAGVRIIRERELDDLQRAGSRRFREDGRGEPVWIEAGVQGRPRTSFRSTIPVGEGLSLTTGFRAGARLRYRMNQIYRQPDGVTDVDAVVDAIRELGTHVWTVPFEAEDARAMELGERHVLDGEATVGVDGGLRFGHKLEELGVLDDVVEAGASASAKVYFSIRGYFRFEVTRERGSRVRVRVTRGHVPREGAALRAFLGVSLRHDLLGSPFDVAVKAASSQLSEALSIEFEAGVELHERDELDVEYVFDLADPGGRRAYEAAIRGNLTVAQELSADGPGEGVVDGRVRDRLVERLSTRAHLRVSLLETGVRSNRTTVRLEVVDLDGNRRVTNTHRYDRSYEGLFGREEDTRSEARHREWLEGERAGEDDLRFAYRFSTREGHVSRGQVDDLLHWVELLFPERGPDEAARVRARRPHDDPENDDAWYLRFPAHWNEYGEVEMTLRATLEERAIDRLRSAPEEAFWDAFWRAHPPDRRPRDWDLRDPSDRRELEWAWSDDELRNDPGFRRAESMLEQGDEALRALASLRAADDRNEAARTLADLAESQRLEPEALIALVTLAGPDVSSLRLRLAGERIDVDLRR